jgi:Icc-related predicted phosphoesterase
MDAARPTVRVAATGDIHCREGNRERVLDAFSGIAGEADLALLAGDLTSHGTVEEAAILCAARERFAGPVFAVLGNHDWHAGEAAGIVDLLGEAGIELLQGGASVCEVEGLEVGIAGAKGFVGGFAPRHLPDFGEPSLRAVYAETTAEVEALDEGLRAVATCPIRLAVLHYSPVEATLEGEPREIFTFLGSDRLAAPILEHGPDLVVHGHAHAGTAEGRIGEVPVYNVSMPLNGSAFRIFEVEARWPAGPIP